MTSPDPRRLYLDEDVPKSAAVIARGLGLDAVAAAEAGPIPREDAQHLATAAAAGRMVVTYNRNDFVELTHEAFAMGKPHHGVLVLTYKLPRNGPRVAHALERWCASHLPLQPYEVQFISD